MASRRISQSICPTSTDVEALRGPFVAKGANDPVILELRTALKEGTPEWLPKLDEKVELTVERLAQIKESAGFRRAIIEALPAGAAEVDADVEEVPERGRTRVAKARRFSTVVPDTKIQSPSTTARHSWQLPMPHSAPRGSPLWLLRSVRYPAFWRAARTLVPSATVTARPSIISSGMGGLRPEALHAEIVGGQRRGGAEHLCGQQFRRAQRRRDTQALVSGRHEHSRPLWMWPHDGQVIRRRAALARP